jgi:hypothetical protein
VWVIVVMGWQRVLAWLDQADQFEQDNMPSMGRAVGGSVVGSVGGTITIGQQCIAHSQQSIAQSPECRVQSDGTIMVLLSLLAPTFAILYLWMRKGEDVCMGSRV